MNNNIFRLGITSVVTFALFATTFPLQVGAQINYATYTPQTQQETIAYLHGVIAQLLAQIAAQQGTVYTGDGRVLGVSYTSPTYTSYSTNYDIEVGTGFLRTDDDDIFLNGSIHLNGAPYVDVWFEYDTDESDFDERTSKRRVYDKGDFVITLDKDDVDESEWYYYRAVAEGPNGRRDYGGTRFFYVSDGSSRRSSDDEPEVNTDQAEDVDEDSAELNGEVDMNDFENGIVFFVYGEDERQIEDVEDDYDSYSDIDEDGADLQKVRVDSDLDGNDDYTERVTGLNDDTEYFYQMCVEYEDDDDDEVIECGGVEEFETDRN